MLFWTSALPTRRTEAHVAHALNFSRIEDNYETTHDSWEPLANLKHTEVLHEFASLQHSSRGLVTRAHVPPAPQPIPGDLSSLHFRKMP
jgi:hypothetical protein